MAASVLFMAPVIVLYMLAPVIVLFMLAQKSFIQGISMGGLKG